MCHEEMQLSRSSTPSRKKRQTKSSGPGWVEVFTDTLLGFLSQPSQVGLSVCLSACLYTCEQAVRFDSSLQLWRSVVDQAFRLVTHCITPAALELILKVGGNHMNVM